MDVSEQPDSSVKPAAQTGAGPGAKTAVRPHLNTITYAWVFGAFWVWTVSGAALTRFAEELKTPDWGFGVLSALPFVAALFQLVGLYVQRPGVKRKSFFLWTVTLGRGMWLVAAMIPWLLPNHVSWWWWLMCGCLFAGWALNNMGGPAWMSWMANVIPHRVRGRYFAMRSRVGMAVGLVATLTVGYILTRISQANDPSLMLKATSAIIGIAGLIGMLDPLAFRTVPDKEVQEEEKTEGVLSMIREALTDRNFRWFVSFSFFLNFGVGLVGQYIWLYILKVVKVSDVQANIMLIAVPLIVMSAGYAFWGKVIDRIGKKPVLIIAGFVVASGVWPWMLVGHGVWPVGVPMVTLDPSWMPALYYDQISLLSIIGFVLAMVACFFWPGVEIANFNLLLNMSGANSGKTKGTAYVAVNAVAVALGGVTAGLTSGLVAKFLEHITYTIPGTTIVLTYHCTLFVLATGLRYLSLICVVKLEEPKATPTRDAFRYITGNLYSNSLDIVIGPMRAVSQVTDFRKLSQRVDLNRRLKQFKAFIKQQHK